MKSKENLFLGMMGSGKSSIGALVSKKLNINFIDIDKEIEKKLGMTISEIFQKNGEKYFRKIEETITLNSLKKNKSVISLGGGAFLNNKIKREILENHLSFWLNWEVSTLIGRIKNSKKRPLAFKITKINLKNLLKNVLLFIQKLCIKLIVKILQKMRLQKYNQYL